MPAMHYAQKPSTKLRARTALRHRSSHKPSARRLTTVGVCATAFIIATAGGAAAHVTVNPAEAESGGYAKLSFRVPNESQTGADTVELSVSFPPEVSSARVRPQPGWAATVERTEDGIQEITWRADDGVGIGPDEFDEFEISVGPLPDDVDRLAFPAVQTYDDEEVVAWDEVVEPGEDEPERPAPILTLIEGAGAGHGHSHSDGSVEEQQPAAAEERPASDDTAADSQEATVTAEDGTARALGVAALVIGVLGLLTSALGLTMARLRRAKAGTSS